jgi:uncharacterized protein (TIRG00374 family)
MKKFVIALVILLTICFVFLKFSEVQEITQLLRNSKIHFIILAVWAEFAYLISVTFTYHAIYKMLEIKEQRRHLFFLSTAANFISVMAPSGGATSLVTFIADARSRQKPTGKVTVAWLIYVIFDYSMLFIIVTTGLIILKEHGAIHWMEIVAAFLLLAIIGFIASVLLLGAKSAHALAKMLNWFGSRLNKPLLRFGRKPFITPEKAEQFSTEVANGVSNFKNNRFSFWKPFLFAAINKGLLIMVYGLIFLALDVPLIFDTVIGSFSMSQLFTIISPTPGGIGIVEGVLPLSLGALGLQIEASTVITLGFRAISYWFSLLIGFLSFQYISKVQNILLRTSE